MKLNTQNTKKIDVKDKKILYELSVNCRIALTALAKKVGVSREVAQYRIKQLVKSGIIIDFITEIDEQKLGFSRYLLYLAFQNVNEDKEKELINYIVKNEFISWTTTTTGKWSLISDLIAKDVAHVQEFIEQLNAKYGEFINEYIIASQISFEHFDTKYYGAVKDNIKKQYKKIQKKMRQKGEQLLYKADIVDFHILKILSKNARMDYVAIAKKLKLSPNTIKERIKKLINAEIITSFYIHPNKTLLGYEQYYIQLDFVNQTKEQEQNIIFYIREHPNMNAYYKPLGHWSIEIAVFVHNQGELRRIILDLRNKFGATMKVHDTMLFYEEPKSPYLPEGVFLG